MSLLCKHYHWTHDFWRRMGTKEFFAWVDQLWSETDKAQRRDTSWDDSDHDPRWQAMREKRKRLRGR